MTTEISQTRWHLEFKAQRVRLELTQVQLALAAGVGQADISRIEQHGWIPPEPIRQKLAEALQIDMERLFPSWALGRAS